MIASAPNPVPTLVPPVEHVLSPEVQVPAQQSSALLPPPGACFVCSTTTRKTYDLLTPSRPQPRSNVGSSRRYSRHADSILVFFQRHRIALASHVQRQFPNLFQTDRATRMHLQTLVAHRDLAVRQGHGIGQANVYSLTQKGLRAIHERQDHDIDVLDQLRRRSPRGSHFLHELLITETAVSITEAIRARPDLMLSWEERFGVIGTPAFTELIPDYLFLLKHSQGLLACLVEVSSGEDSPTRIGQKLTQYATWSLNLATQEFLIDLYRRHGAQHPRPQYRLLLVIHDRRSTNDRARIRQVLGQTLTLPQTMRSRIWIASAFELGEVRNIDAPVWVRAKDLDAHEQDWETLSPRERRQLLHKITRKLPRHRLFPSPENPHDAHAPQDQPHGVDHPPRADPACDRDRFAP